MQILKTNQLLLLFVLFFFVTNSIFSQSKYIDKDRNSVNAGYDVLFTDDDNFYIIKVGYSIGWSLDIDLSYTFFSENVNSFEGSFKTTIVRSEIINIAPLLGISIISATSPYFNNYRRVSKTFNGVVVGIDVNKKINIGEKILFVPSFIPRIAFYDNEISKDNNKALELKLSTAFLYKTDDNISIGLEFYYIPDLNKGISIFMIF